MPLIYGHRGARGECPENTLASFQHCLEQGVTRCELDLHLSADDELMVIHDPTLKRTTGQRGKVGRYSAAELEQLDARAAGPAWPQPCPIPRLRKQLPTPHASACRLRPAAKRRSGSRNSASTSRGWRSVSSTIGSSPASASAVCRKRSCAGSCNL